MSSAATNASTTIGGILSNVTNVRRSLPSSPISWSFMSRTFVICLGWSMYSRSFSTLGRLGSRPYIQNTNAIVAVPSAMDASVETPIHLRTRSQLRVHHPPGLNTAPSTIFVATYASTRVGTATYLRPSAEPEMTSTQVAVTANTHTSATAASTM